MVHHLYMPCPWTFEIKRHMVHVIHWGIVQTIWLDSAQALVALYSRNSPWCFFLLQIRLVHVSHSWCICLYVDRPFFKPLSPPTLFQNVQKTPSVADPYHCHYLMSLNHITCACLFVLWCLYASLSPSTPAALMSSPTQWLDWPHGISCLSLSLFACCAVGLPDTYSSQPWYRSRLLRNIVLYYVGTRDHRNTATAGPGHLSQQV